MTHTLLRYLRIPLLAVLLGGTVPLCAAMAQEMEVSTELQFSLFEKIVSFDRTPPTLHNGEFVVGVLYQRSVRASAWVAEDVLAFGGKFTFNGRKVRYVALPVSSAADIDAVLSRTPLTLLYVTPMRAPDIDAVTRVSRKLHILTMTGVRSFAEDGLAVAISKKGDRPLVVINLPASKAEGAEFNSQLLRIAQTIQ